MQELEVKELWWEWFYDTRNQTNCCGTGNQNNRWFLKCKHIIYAKYVQGRPSSSWTHTVSEKTLKSGEYDKRLFLLYLSNNDRTEFSDMHRKLWRWRLKGHRNWEHEVTLQSKGPIWWGLHPTKGEVMQPWWGYHVWGRLLLRPGSSWNCKGLAPRGTSSIR